MKIAVYMGSTPGQDPDILRAAEELGTWIGRNGHVLVFGGSKTGVMGVVASAVLAAGGQVTGVMPRFLSERELAHPGLTEFHMTETMAERKTMMLQLADVYVALPGGIGTLEEISEAMSLTRLGRIQGRCFLLDINGFWKPMRGMLEAMCAQRFVSREDVEKICFPASVKELAALLQP